jgi:hypothetical protein
VTRWHAALTAALVIGAIHAGLVTGQPSRSPNNWDNLDPSVLPEGLDLSADQVLRLVVPEYDKKVSEILALRARRDVPWADTESYEVAVARSARIRIGSPPHDVLVVLVHEQRNTCNLCHYTLLGLVDLSTKVAAPSFYAEGKPEALLIIPADSSGVTKVLFTVCYGNKSAGTCTEWRVRPVLRSDRSWRLRREHWRIVQRWSTPP